MESGLRERTDRIRSMDKARLKVIKAEQKYVDLVKGCLLEDVKAWPAQPLVQYPDEYGYRPQQRATDKVLAFRDMVGDMQDYSMYRENGYRLTPVKRRALVWGENEPT